jgi:hypothetical protein
VLWENDIDKIAMGNSYELSSVMVRQYNQTNYLSFNKQSVIVESFATIEREDEQSTDNNLGLAKVFCPADGVQSIRRFLSCNKCHSKLALMHCTENLGKIKKCFYVGSMSPCVVFHRTQVIVRKFLTIKKIANIANISLLT